MATSTKKKYPNNLRNVSVVDDELIFEIGDKQYKYNLSEISQRLKSASQVERENFKISPSGYGLSWPAIDEDLSIDGLLGIKHKPTFKKPKIAS